IWMIFLSAATALLGIVLVLWLGSRVLAVCPSMCSCSHSHREVDCSWRGLRLLPDGLQHNLRSLNLSHNRFQNLDGQLTAYTHLRILDLSHNRLNQLPVGLPRSLWQLTHFYLHANRFTTLPFGVLDKTTSLRVITLGDNPWACHLYADTAYLVSWTQRTSARVLGCPCHTQPVCGGVRPGRTGGWHFASYNLPPLAASAQDLSSTPPEASVTGWWYFTVSALLSTPHTPKETLNTQPHTSTPTLTSRTTGTHLTINHLSATCPLVAKRQKLMFTPKHCSHRQLLPGHSLSLTETTVFSRI
uniref:LRRNT domain-containing protein n=1 Tax=Amphiprion percula TaxID=161767 RepID=A0A3P8SFH4_AMPPE